MKPVFQTRFGADGNCFEASVASLFELPLEEVPDFGKDDFWYDRFTTWCKRHFGLQPLELTVEDGGWRPDGYHLISGMTSRGLRHSVVGYGGEEIHDPYPGAGEKIEDPETFTVFAALLNFGRGDS